MESRGVIGFSPPPPPPPLGNDILCEILSRSCVKSLMRFKCVCKHWRFLIEQDTHFIHLHFSRSKTRPNLLVHTKFDNDGTSIFWTDLFLGGTSSIQKLTTSLCTEYMLTPINGLTCFTYWEGAVRIYNLSTRQVTPLLESSLKNELQQEEEEEEEEEEGIFQVHNHRHPKNSLIPWYAFGYDPDTNKHKVLCVWDIFRHNTSPPRVDQVCEVLTVGENRWRRINDVPPSNLRGHPVYVNGAIYWLNKTTHYNVYDPLMEVLMVFDVGSEKLRKIQFPNFILDQFSRSSCLAGFGVQLLQVDRGLALIHKTRVQDNIRIKMWKIDEEDTKNWIEETVSVCFDREKEMFCCFQVIDDKEVIITIPNNPMDGLFFYFYCYNREKNTTSRKVEITTNTIGGRFPINESHYCYNIMTFVESLLPVQHHQHHHSEFSD